MKQVQKRQDTRVNLVLGRVYLCVTLASLRGTHLVSARPQRTKENLPFGASSIRIKVRLRFV